MRKFMTVLMVMIISVISPLASLATQVDDMGGTTFKNVDIQGFHGGNATGNNGEALPTDDPNAWHEGNPVGINYKWCIDDNVDIEKGDTTTVTLPPNSVLDTDTEFDILDGLGNIVGHFSGKKGEATGTITWNGYFKEHPNNKCGEISFAVHGDRPDPNRASFIAKNGWVIGEPDEQGHYHQIMWNLLINPASRTLTDTVVTDGFTNPEYHSIDEGSFRLTYKDGGTDQEEVPADVYNLSVDQSTGSFVMTFNGELKRPVQVLYTSTLKEGIEYLQNGKTTLFRNDVNLKANENGNPVTEDAYKEVVLSGGGSGIGEDAGKIEVIKHDEDDDSLLLAGAEFDVYDSQGNLVDHVIVGENGHGLTEKRMLVGEYKLIETKAPEGYEIDETPHYVKVEGTETATIVIYIGNKRPEPVKGSIEVIKHDSLDKKKLLAGAEFDVKDAAGQVVDHIVTDEDGYGVTTVPLDFGEYTLVETKAPEGYELDTTPIEVSVFEGEETNVVTVDVDNRQLPGEPIIPTLPGKGSIEVIKHDLLDKEKLLAGAEFDVFDATGEVVDHIIVGKNGHGLTTVPLDFGEYTLVETTAPEGYELDSTPIPVSVVEGKESNVITVDVDNRQLPGEPIIPTLPGKGTIEVIKHDLLDKEKLLAGAEFDVKDADGKIIDHIITGEDGHGLTSVPLDFGEYTLVETKAPEGYELDSTPIEVSVFEGEETNVVTVDVDNRQLPGEPIIPTLPGKGTIEVIKHDSLDKEVLLAGAGFDIMDSEGNFIEHITTDATGRAVSTTPLDFGEYTLVETEAPEGYELDTTPIPVSVVEGKESNVITVDVDNRKLPGEPIIPMLPGKGTIEVIKHDSLDKEKLLAGAEFDVKDAEGNVIDHIVTGEDGHGVTTVPLDFGEYTLVETKAPEGYKLDSKPIQVTVVEGEENNVATVDVLNTKLPEKPTKPEYPVDPEKPTTPGKPGQPTEPGKPKVPNTPNHNILPQTSEVNSSYLTLIGSVLLIGLAFIQVRRFK